MGDVWACLQTPTSGPQRPFRPQTAASRASGGSIRRSLGTVLSDSPATNPAGLADRGEPVHLVRPALGTHSQRGCEGGCSEALSLSPGQVPLPGEAHLAAKLLELRLPEEAACSPSVCHCFPCLACLNLAECPVPPPYQQREGHEASSVQRTRRTTQ